MKGTRITVTSKPRGVNENIIVVGTPVPGTMMEIVNTAEIGGVFSYAVYGTLAHSSGQGVENDGDRKAIAILLEKDDEGGMFDRAYVTGEWGRIYFPVMGEQFNVWHDDVSGTGDDHHIGQELMLVDGTGSVIVADNNAQAHPFTCLEAQTNPLADRWLYVRFNGEGGA